MADEKVTPKPGLKKAPPRPDRVDAMPPAPRLTPFTTKAVRPEDYQREFSDLPVDSGGITPVPPLGSGLTGTTPISNPIDGSIDPSSSPIPPGFLGLSPEQLNMIAEQLKTIAVSAIKSSMPPPKPRPSMPVRATKAAGKSAGFISLGVMIAGIVVEWAARTYLDVDGPWTEFLVRFGNVLRAAGN